MKAHVLRALALVLVALPTSGCSALVFFDLSQAPTCDGPDDCLAGRVCVDGTCVGVDGGAIPELPGTVGPNGGTLRGDGATVEIPAGAVDANVVFALTARSSTILPPGVTPSTRVFAISPARTLGVPATITLPLVAPCGAGCAVFLADAEEGPYGAVGPATVAGDVVSGALPRTAIVVIGTPASLDDAGVVDGGDGDAGAPSDGGAPDAGSTLFASCDFGPSSCDPGQRCAPVPGVPGAGFCTRAAAPGACPIACTCCEVLPGETGESCLPVELCGDGALYASCTSGADCDVAVAPRCEAGEPVDGGPSASCTTTCDTSADCAGGCCVPTLFGTERVCATGVACARVTGALCVDDAGCASGACAAPAGGAPRCTEPCTPGSCGPSLSCLPITCDAFGAVDGRCVPSSLADADTLYCGSTCVDDAACAGDLCVEGACATLPACECLTHDHCAVGSACIIDPGVLATCDGSAAAPCCGACTALAPACARDADCPPSSTPGAVALCVLDPGCEDDPYGQCQGACADVTGACAVDDDCASPLLCVDHRCR